MSRTTLAVVTVVIGVALRGNRRSGRRDARYGRSGRGGASWILGRSGLAGRAAVQRRSMRGAQVVGTNGTAGGQQHAFLWQNGKMRDLGTLGGRDSGASAINASGR